MVRLKIGEVNNDLAYRKHLHIQW